MLTHFQKTAMRALGLPEEIAATIQPNWPNAPENLEDILFECNERIDSPIQGVQILTACSVIWDRKPLDHSEAEGREVLYHPLDGTPIPAGSPLDGITWEVLAFLRWAHQKSQLNWSDEVIIAREVKGAGGTIGHLPPDRFYAKNMLPRSGEDIDWSNVALAKAKAFVVTGKANVENDPVEESIYYDGKTLCGVLSSISALQDEAARSHLLRGLPRGPVGSMPRSSAPSTDLDIIVETAKGMGRLTDGQMATDVIIKNAQRYVRGTAKAAVLNKFKS